MQSIRSSARNARAAWPAWCCAALLAACGGKQAAPPPAPPEVSVVTLKAQAVTIVTELPGRTAAYRVAEVRPQIGGVVLKRLFTEGGEVKAGEQLYQIDPAPFKAARDSAQASLARAQATLISAKLLAERYAPLAEARAVSRQDYDNAVAAQAQAQADVASARATLETARINLVYTRVLSPIAGRTGRSSVTEGALVQANQTNALVTVQQLDPIYVDVVQPSTVLLRLKRELADGKLKKIGEDQAQARITLEDGSAYAENGRLQFAEVAVDPGTGSVTLRAIYPNPQRFLLPGMFVRERIDEGVDENALLVPQRGVTHSPRGEATALVVGADGKVQSRVITTARAIGSDWLVSAGLKAGDRVIVEGLQRARPGIAVSAHEMSADETQRPSSQPEATAAPDSEPVAP